ncbi:Putative metallopeptidase [Rhizobium sp. RU33A]|uniref:DUF4344 domain-containing metallopeptidase n=1 Tax=Rhizobium sp. RU33A TaxID=1907413 RepID=UPI000956A6FE|nr:DUF4344 domain-containing metallopeptidase [Rhizobium sp. RU33A]SIQ59376.1 Putative metallopeptidase [Rhizobium sp. RU33A]
MESLKSAVAAALLMTSAILFASPSSLTAEELTAEQVEEGQRFVVNNAIFILFHEAGHMLVSEFNLPVLGREEDAVDALSSVLLLGAEDEDLYTTMQDAADGWFLLDEAKEDGPQEDDFMGTHGLDRQRAYSIVCMMTGANAEFFDEFADSLEFPEDRREECLFEYAKARDSWMSLLADNMKDGAKTKFEVTYEPAGNEDLQGFADLLKGAGALEAVATVFEDGYNLKDGIKITGKTCGTENAFWYEGDREITYCYEMAAFHATLIANWFENQTAGEEQPAGEDVADETSEEETEATSVKLKRKE